MGAGYQDHKTDAVVIGVVDDVRYPMAPGVLLPEMYFSHRQMQGRFIIRVVTLLLRAPGDSGAVARALRSAVRDADKELVPEAVTTLEERMPTGLARPRLYAILLAGFAAFALLVAVLTRFVAALLYGITPNDGITYVGTSIFLLAVAGAACLAPARRAARQDPVAALRE